ncbi:hypothetical protein GCM10009817_10790 [Terrabacter lapilli]|uniref:Peptidoglycan binding protein n=1 Tax=Terrabacter lapilli TaxID=436231 RepID=A0ABN2RPR7_9MICO
MPDPTPTRCARPRRLAAMLALTAATSIAAAGAPAAAATVPAAVTAALPDAVTAALPVTVTAPTAPAPVVPPGPAGLPAGIERPAAYVPSNDCDPVAKPGTVRLGDLLKATYGSYYRTVETCAPGPRSTSEHFDGRAVDFFLNVRDATQSAQASAFLSWLTAPDAAGNAFANARRLGVMYVIWNDKIWATYRASEGWRPYSNCASTPASSSDTNCHRNHIHISMSWEGAMGRTSYWTRTVAGQDFGPCRVPDLNWAPRYAGFNPNPCASYPTVVAPSGSSALLTTLVTNSGMDLRYGSSGPVVSAVQTALGVSATGAFDSRTQSALSAWQSRHQVAATGVMDPATWRAMLKAFGFGAPPSTGGVHGFDADGIADVLAVTSTGSLRLYRGDGAGYVTGGSQIGAGWNMFDTVFSPGDFSGDGKADLVARTPAGALFLYRGNGVGGFTGGGVQIGSGWNMYDTVFSPGDFTGDGRPDLLGRTPAGALYLYRGNGAGGFTGGGVQIGSGWNMFDMVLGAGDFTGDGRPDLFGRTPSGALYLYRGNGAGGFTGGGVQVGAGWGIYRTVFSAGDLNRDGHVDIVGVKGDGSFIVYAGDSSGRFTLAGRGAGTGWTFPAVFAVS